MTELVDTYYVAGVGIGTVERIEYNLADRYTSSLTESGDSLVVTWSATLGNRCSNRTFYAHNVDHTSLVENNSVTRFIIRLIKGNTSITNLSDVIKENIPDTYEN